MKEKSIGYRSKKKLASLIGKLQLGNDKMSVEAFVHMLGEDISKHELTNNEVVAMALSNPLGTCVELDLNSDLIDILDVDI
jgi:hypothetical protein